MFSKESLKARWHIQRLGPGSGSRFEVLVIERLSGWSPGKPPPTGKTAVDHTQNERHLLYTQ